MSNSTSNSNKFLKVSVVILILMLLGSLYYISTITKESETIKTVLATKVSEKESILNDLNALKKSYDVAISENGELADELVKEREKVVKLIKEVEASKGSLTAFRAKYANLERSMNTLIDENKGLKIQKTVLVNKLDSTSVILNEEKKNNVILSGQNEDLSKVVEKGSKLIVTNIQSATFKSRKSGKQIPTDRASSTDIIKINYTIAENKITQQKDIEYYVQIIDSENNVLGEKQTINFGNKSLTFSLVSKAKYDNKTLVVKEEIKSKNLQKGKYFVNLFNREELVMKTSFDLK